MHIEKYYKLFNIFFILFFFLIITDAFFVNFGYFLSKQFPNSILTIFTDLYKYESTNITPLTGKVEEWWPWYNEYLRGYGTDGTILVDTSKKEGWRDALWNENGAVEIIQEIILFINIIILLRLFYQSYNFSNLIIILFLFFEILGLTYFFLEEISYGQHFINFKTPEFFLNLNHQKEFNLHNTSNLFNELPRTFVYIWCGLSIICLTIFKPKINLIFYQLIKPNKKLIYISLCLILFTIPDFIVSKFDLINYSELKIFAEPKAPVFSDCGYRDCLFIGYDRKMFYTILLSFNFFRLSELQEFIFAYYFLWHTLFLKKNIFKNENRNNNY